MQTGADILSENLTGGGVEATVAVGVLEQVAKSTRRGAVIIVNISGRGDKDVAEVARTEGVSL